MEGEFFYQAESRVVFNNFFYGESFVVFGDDEAVAAPVELLVFADCQGNFFLAGQVGALALTFQGVITDIFLLLELLFDG